MAHADALSGFAPLASSGSDRLPCAPPLTVDGGIGVGLVTRQPLDYQALLRESLGLNPYLSNNCGLDVLGNMTAISIYHCVFISFIQVVKLHPLTSTHLNLSKSNDVLPDT